MVGGAWKRSLAPYRGLLDLTYGEFTYYTLQTGQLGADRGPPSSFSNFLAKSIAEVSCLACDARFLKGLQTSTLGAGAH